MNQNYEELNIIEHSNMESNYLDHLEIKYRVFVYELGWDINVENKTPIRCVPDSVDKDSMFLTCYTDSRVPVGTVKATPLSRQFPHRDLFINHFGDERFSSNIHNLYSINALAVLPEYRRKIFKASAITPSGTAAMQMMVMLIATCWDRGFRGAITTSSNPWATLLFKRLGFIMIDKPFKSGIYSHNFVNFGIAFGSKSHIQALSNIYGESDRENRFLQESSINEYFLTRQKMLE